MPQLRHVITDDERGSLEGAYCLPDSSSDKEDMVMENLQTLSYVKNLKFGKGVLTRIPNIKTLKLHYKRKADTSGEEDYYSLNNVCCLHKLETLRVYCGKDGSQLMQEVSFPYSLKKLTLVDTKLPWEDMKTKIGSLPHLQVLKLKRNSFSGPEWETFEDQFLNLKFLLIEHCDIKRWITNNTHFPRLEQLVLQHLDGLTEIPSCMGDIPTLHLIQVRNCSKSMMDSAETIREEQQELGNEDLRIIII